MATGQDVADFLGRGTDTELVALADVHVTHMTNLVRAYTRGQGFTADVPAADLDSVIVTSAARLVSNPEGVQSETVGAYSVAYAVQFSGWTLAEQMVLNSYRRRLA